MDFLFLYVRAKLNSLKNWTSFPQMKICTAHSLKTIISLENTVKNSLCTMTIIAIEMIHLAFRILVEFS